jgi:hypothetical protein
MYFGFLWVGYPGPNQEPRAKPRQVPMPAVGGPFVVRGQLSGDLRRRPIAMVSSQRSALMRTPSSVFPLAALECRACSELTGLRCALRRCRRYHSRSERFVRSELDRAAEAGLGVVFRRQERIRLTAGDLRRRRRRRGAMPLRGSRANPRRTGNGGAGSRRGRVR